LSNKKIIVLGGGNAGFMTALFVGRLTNADISVIHNEEKGTVGVGEATVPTIRGFIEGNLGIDIRDFISKTKSTIKNGIKFQNWNGDGKYYYHPFLPELKYLSMFKFADEANPNPYYTYQQFLKQNIQNNSSFSEFDFGSILSEQNKVSEDLSYALHFDNFLVTEYYKNVCIARGIKVIDDEYMDANLDEDGYITSLELKKSGTLDCDFVFDCSGFAKLLINKKYNINWQKYKDLAVNEAIIFNTETNPNDEIPSYTQATALKNGWVFEIPLRHRIGRGYIFDNNFTSTDKAVEEVIENYGDVDFKKDIRFEGGRLEKFWYKNCISVGLSASFIEPLESTSIWFTTVQLTELLPLSHAFFEKQRADYIRTTYDKVMIATSDHLKDFVHYHYLGKRKDSMFWKSFRDTYKSSDFVNSMLEAMKYGDYQEAMIDQNALAKFTFNGWLAVSHGLGIIEPDKMVVENKELVPSAVGGKNMFKTMANAAKSHLEYLRV
jgi:tryptophan halogenase